MKSIEHDNDDDEDTKKRVYKMPKRRFDYLEQIRSKREDR